MNTQPVQNMYNEGETATMQQVVVPVQPNYSQQQQMQYAIPVQPLNCCCCIPLETGIKILVVFQFLFAVGSLQNSGYYLNLLVAALALACGVAGYLGVFQEDLQALKTFRTLFMVQTVVSILHDILMVILFAAGVGALVTQFKGLWENDAQFHANQRQQAKEIVQAFMSVMTCMLAVGVIIAGVFKVYFTVMVNKFYKQQTGN